MESQETEILPEQTVRSVLSGLTRCFGPGLALASALVVSLPAHAEEPKDPARERSTPPAQPSVADVRKADTLFQKARLLKKLGKDAEACALFVESQGAGQRAGEPLDAIPASGRLRGQVPLITDPSGGGRSDSRRGGPARR